MDVVDRYSFGAGSRPAATVRSSGSDGAGQRSVRSPSGDAAALLGVDAARLAVGAAPEPTPDRATTTAATTTTALNRISGVRMTVPSELSLRPGSHYAFRQGRRAPMLHRGPMSFRSADGLTTIDPDAKER